MKISMCLVVSLAVQAVGCDGGTATTSTTGTGGNASLGISAFQINETNELTTVVGVDAQNKEVARLELVHGNFMPTEDFGEENNGHLIDGRKLTVAIKGQTMSWETLGYTDTLHMPSLPRELNTVAALVTDQHVRPLLEKWSIGWDGETGLGAGEVAYDNNGDPYHEGSNPTACNFNGGTGTCSIRSGTSGRTTTPACGGGAEWMGEVVDNYTSNGDPYDGSTVFFCCGNGSSGNPNGYAAKTCAASSGGTGCTAGHFCSACGDGGSNKCISCINVAYSNDCTLWTQSDGSTGETEVFHSYDNGACLNAYDNCSGSNNCCYGTSCGLNWCWGGSSCDPNNGGTDCCSQDCEWDSQIDDYQCTSGYATVCLPG